MIVKVESKNTDKSSVLKTVSLSPDMVLSALRAYLPFDLPENITLETYVKDSDTGYTTFEVLDSLDLCWEEPS